MMSKTAERFWDWATTAAISSLVASASMSKVTRMRAEAVADVGVDAEDAVQVHVALDARLDRVELDAAVLGDGGDAGGEAARQRREHDLDRRRPVVGGGKLPGWSASMKKLALCDCSAPTPKKPSTVDLLCTPPSHSQLARQVNWPAAGVSVRAARAPRRASTSTPLSTVLTSVCMFISVSNSLS